MTRNPFVLPVVGLLLAALLLAGLWLGLEYHLDGRVAYGVRVLDRDLSGIPMGEAGVIIEELSREIETKPVRLIYRDRAWEIIPEQVGIQVDRNAILQQAYGAGRRGVLLEQARDRWDAWRKGKKIEIILAEDEERRIQYFQDIARELNKRPQNASLDLDTLAPIPGQSGLQVEHEASWQRLEEELRQNLPGPVSLVVREVEPATTAEEILSLGELDILGQAVTVFDRGEENRTANIQVAAASLDGVLLEPGEILSFNEIVGPRDPEYGFLEAPELVNLELVPGYGGGVCQVSSTLFHAGLLAGMDVRERYCHSRPVAYIPMGLDATVAYDYLDLKLANPGISPLLIVARTREDRLAVAILGKKWTPEAIRLETGEIEEVPIPIEYVSDPTLLPGEILEEEPGAPGYRVRMERVIGLERREIRREVVSESYYLPRPRVFRSGPGLELEG